MYDCGRDHECDRGCGHDDGARGHDGDVRDHVHDLDVLYVNAPRSFVAFSFPRQGDTLRSGMICGFVEINISPHTGLHSIRGNEIRSVESTVFFLF